MRLFFSEELADLGIEVYYHSVVGDNPERLESLLKTADQRSDLVVLLWRVRHYYRRFNQRCCRRSCWSTFSRRFKGRKELEAFFTRAKREMTANNLRQVLVFEEGNALPNETGLAIGIFYQSPTTAFLLFAAAI